ncbi:MAG: cytochrome c [Acidimicrobiia bacterium]
MSTPSPRSLGVAVLLVLALTACGGSAGNDAGTGIEPQDPELVALGEELYQANCASCHGVDLRGTDQGPSQLSVVYEPGHHGDAAYYLAVRNGVVQHHWPFGDMPPVEGLADPEIEAIVAFIRETQRVNGFEPYPPG